MTLKNILKISLKKLQKFNIFVSTQEFTPNCSPVLVIYLLGSVTKYLDINLCNFIAGHDKTQDLNLTFLIINVSWFNRYRKLIQNFNKCC